MSQVKSRTGEAQYEEVVSEIRKRGPEKMGLMSSWTWIDDPKRLVFMLSRYKFVAKMVEGSAKVLEVGCGDGFGARVVAQSVGSVTAIDFDPEFIESARANTNERFSINFKLHDMLSGPVNEGFDAAYSLDVLEHILPEKEDEFLSNVAGSLANSGVLIVGTPSLESQTYASKYSKMGHVNCKTQPQLKTTMSRHFNNVFMFSMNDEVVHTGYSKMSHYNLAVACGPKHRL
jgi:2-polyprenyl-3-methyl-5-hydroxy-6-metoxy-1,4-benzoquinol methylase